MNYYPGQNVYENKRVVLITGNQSKWYEQAIFIIKKDAGRKAPPTDFVKEAESIIDSYMKTLDHTRHGGTANFVQAGDGDKVELSDFSPPPLGGGRGGPPKGGPQGTKRKSKGFDWFLNLTMLVACIVIFYVISTQLF